MYLKNARKSLYKI